ncbi:MAG TPA: HAMP domain-containing sensor histidine kinase [Deltaproteobacteria bacterium]|nr:HAMP domain-containing sensor histidine kinase [Deltaproteobacteria bacterium]
MEQPRRWPTILILITIQAAWLIIVIMLVVGYVHYRHIRMEPVGVWDVVVVVEVSILFTMVLAGIYVLFILYQKQLTLMRTQMHIIQSVTHAFKTPIATMQLYLETILTRELPEKTKAELIQGMVIVNQRLKSLVYNFLESARLSSGRRPYTFAVAQVPQLVSEFLDRNEVFLKDMDVRLHTADEDIPIAADAVALDMVFSNLMENAIHYATSLPRVDIRVWKDAKWAFIEFSDTGIGIPKERHRDIFKMFKRLPDAVSLWSSGTGMGLYVVKGIIKAHGGTIHVKSSTLGEGTSFSIRLPLARP